MALLELTTPPCQIPRVNNRRFLWFVFVLLVSMDDTGPALIVQSLVFMAGFEVLYLGLRWLAGIPRRTAAEARERREILERLFP